MNTLEILDIPMLAATQKHPTVFKTFDSLKEGSSFILQNDHAPIPLFDEMKAARGETFIWEKLENGPVTWKVKITKSTSSKKDVKSTLIQKNNANQELTLGELAAKDIRTAEVFKKYGLDFCCGGKKSLRQACEEKKLDEKTIRKELQEVSQTKGRNTSFDFNRWNLDFLADYIFNEHHQYWYDQEPVISELLRKVVAHHGAKYPELRKVADLYTTLKQELDAHFKKEERVLFPHIKELVKAKRTNTLVATGLENINEPLKMMEADHEAAGEILSELRTVTNEYTQPGDACNSFNLLYHQLKALEEDLHQHIHLENNILFPKSALLHKELQKLNLLK